MKKVAICICLALFVIKVGAQEKPQMETDSIAKVKAADTEIVNLRKKTIISDSIGRQDMNPAAVVFKPNPTKAVIYSAIFPGLGQIYNRKYWKLPLVYGGFLGLTYAVTWNNRYLTDYSAAYKAVMSENPLSPENVAKWEDFLPRNDKASNYGTAAEVRSKFSSSFKRKKDFYRRNRDLSIIGMVALYGLCIVDAYVDAQLFEFDISPDISMRVEPTMMMNSYDSKMLASQRTLGVQCSLKF